MIKIGGLQKTSLIEYSGKISAILFTQGCNFRCPYCHNPELVIPSLFEDQIPEEEIMDYLKMRVSYLEAVVITGGEPCLQKGLIEFMQNVKSLGYYVKLETNGSFPGKISEMIKHKAVDYIGMDIKGPLGKYNQIIKAHIDPGKISESIGIIKNSGIHYEFQTTAVKSMLQKEDFEEIGQLAHGAKRFFLQKFYPTKTLDPDFLNEENYSDSDLMEFREIMKRYVGECEIR
jgi:pyruvate formate lyase activating enzyme